MLWQLLPCIFWYFSLPETVEENLHKLYTGLGATFAEKKKKHVHGRMLENHWKNMQFAILI